MNRRLAVIVIGLALLLTRSDALAQATRPLDHGAYEIWHGIADEALSRDGRWVMYRLTLQNGDPELVVRSLTDDREMRLPRATDARFSAAGGHVVALVQPAKEEARRARLDGDDKPRAELGIIDLSTGTISRVESVKSFALPEKAGGWVAYLLEEAPDATDDETDNDTGTGTGTGSEPDDGDKTTGSPLVYRDLDSGVETWLESVAEYAASDDGALLAYLTSTVDGAADGAFVLRTGNGDIATALQGAGRYTQLALDDAGSQVAFLTDRDDREADQPEFAVYGWDGGGEARRLAAAGTAGLPTGWSVSEHRGPEYSRDGERLYFGTAPSPPAEPEAAELLDEEKVVVDVWHWQDPLLQPMQLLQAEEEAKRTYLAVVHLDDGHVVQLADPEVPDAEPVGDDDSFLHGESGVPYRKEISWDSPRIHDHYVIETNTGARRKISGAHQGAFELAPDGHHALLWDDRGLGWRGCSWTGATTGAPPTCVELTHELDEPLHDERHDWAYRPQPHGFAGWTDDGSALVYDRYDVWALDPSGEAEPLPITDGTGRASATRLRIVPLDPERETFDPAVPLLLSAFNEETKNAGFWRHRIDGVGEPAVLVDSPHRYGRPAKAAEADTLLFTRESVDEFADLWISDLGMTDARQVSDANPQQGDYNWATAELTTWRSLDGERLEGLIHKPADFNPSNKYPLLVTFYERNADNLHQHHPPTPHRSVIRQGFYASRGYVVFTPDITYQVGYPGESALKDVVSGVLHMIDRGYVDEHNIGVQGHSWGGYQIAYMVTKTNIFKAAAGGAVVANMTSAYGGIRWGTGMSRMFQYEKTQSRLGATLWEAPMRYLENSPLFWADKIETPLMMMHNDHDSAVPWEQGIEMFVALRRLGKPAWLINYNGEPHWPTTHANKVDWNIRMQQFFDHYLKGAPAPRWLAEGIPAIEKGKTLGLELSKDGRQPER